jgi:hypothetical protein
MPRYVNCISTQDELKEVKRKVILYQQAESREKTVNFKFSRCIMGHAKQLWRIGLWRSHSPDDILARLVAYQKRNFAPFGHRPVGQLATRVRDYVSLRAKTPTISTSRLETFFKDLWKTFENEVVVFLDDSGVLTEARCLRETVDAGELDDTLQRFRDSPPPSLVEQIIEKFVAIRDGSKEWEVLFPLSGVKVEAGDQLPELYHVKFLNGQEAQAFYDTRVGNQSRPRMDFSSVEGAVLISQVEARDVKRAAQIAHRILRTTFDQFLFTYQYGHHSNPRLHDLEACCIEATITGTPRVVWLPRVYSHRQSEQELLLRHPNNVDKQRGVIEGLSRLAKKAEAGHSLAKRAARAIYWHRKGRWDPLAEDRLLHYWVSLETLVGHQNQGEGTTKTIVPYRTGLLAPAKVPVDGRITYRQLRDWTREFIEDVYRLRNEIIHGGIVEGPSFERFVDRLGSTVASAIHTVLTALTLELPAPDSLEELLTWIWDRNPDSQVPVPAGLTQELL